MNENYETYKLLQPWSTFVLKTKLPKNILKKMIELTDRIVVDSEAENMGPGLAGQIAWEPKIELKLIEKTDIEKYFYNTIHQYCMRAHMQSHPFDYDEFPALTEYLITVMWIVSQKDNEYNPLHIHEGCSLSAVMYLKVPKFLLPARKTRDEDQDGNIVFYQTPTDSSGGFGYVNRLSLKPKVGDFYIFPSHQAHLVYPFRTIDGKGERRSVAFNISCKRDEKEFDEWEKKKYKKTIKTTNPLGKKIKRY